MKHLLIFRMGLTFLLFTTLREQALCQTAQQIQTAGDFYDAGCDSYSKGDFASAVKYFNSSLYNVPTAVGYYFLGLSYSSLPNNTQAAYSAIQRALNFKNPPLDDKFVLDAQSMKDNLHNQLYPPPPSQEGVTAAALSAPPLLPGKGNFPLKRKVTPSNGGKTRMDPSNAGKGRGVLVQDRFIFPGMGVRNENNTIGDFCCTGETATVLRADNVPVGYIYFYDFEGGMNLGNNRSTVTKLKILLSAAPTMQDVSSDRIKDMIVFSGNEMVANAVRSKRVGALMYTVTIISVNKYSNDSFYSDGIRVQVDISE
jgi:hypothetical protein